MDTPTHKYFKTHHLPWTLASTADDKILSHAELAQYFLGMDDAYVSIKLDGENTTIGRGYSHARSLDSKGHWSRDHIKQLAATLINDIPPGWRVCGENMLATHSIEYTNLESFFYVFSVWDEHNVRLSLDDMIEFCECLDLKMAPILKRGRFQSFIPHVKKHFGLDLTKDEGYVISNAKPFHYDDAKKNVAKFVREGHVQTDEHWMTQTKRNKLQSSL